MKQLIIAIAASALLGISCGSSKSATIGDLKVSNDLHCQEEGVIASDGSTLRCEQPKVVKIGDEVVPPMSCPEDELVGFDDNGDLTCQAGLSEATTGYVADSTTAACQKLRYQVEPMAEDDYSLSVVLAVEDDLSCNIWLDDQ